MAATKKITKRTKRATTSAKRSVRKSVKVAKKEVSPISVENIKTKVKDLNKFVLESTDVMVDETFDRTAEWQQVLDKAIKGGLSLGAKQQDLVFDALESMKSSVIKSGSRFKNIFSKN